VSYSTALLILAICTVLAVVVAAPFIYLVRWLRRRRTNQGRESVGKKMTVAEVLPQVLLVLVMFLAFAHEIIAPEGWLGSRVKTGEGKFWFSVLIFLLLLVLNYAWTLFKYRKRNTKQD
jgi:heme/copper-type cytochrome/quinol oxidase subunit 2